MGGPGSGRGVVVAATGGVPRSAVSPSLSTQYTSSPCAYRDGGRSSPAPLDPTSFAPTAQLSSFVPGSVFGSLPRPKSSTTSTATLPGVGRSRAAVAASFSVPPASAGTLATSTASTASRSLYGRFMETSSHPRRDQQSGPASGSTQWL